MHRKERSIKGLNKVSTCLLARRLRNCSLPSEEENLLFWRANPSLQYPEGWIPQEEEKRWPNAFQLTELVLCDLKQFLPFSCLVLAWLLVFGVVFFVLFCFFKLSASEKLARDRLTWPWELKFKNAVNKRVSLMLQHIYARRTHIKDSWATFFNVHLSPYSPRPIPCTIWIKVWI